MATALDMTTQLATFRLKGGRVAWEAAGVVEDARSRSGRTMVRISRFVFPEGPGVLPDGRWNLRVVTRYVEPDTPVELVEEET